MNVSKFITDLLDNNKKMSTNNKKKLVELVNNEINNGIEISPLIRERLKKLASELYNSSAPSNAEILQNTNEETNIDKLRYKHPLNLIGFLVDFNKNVILKSTTHPIDSNMLGNLLESMKITRYNYKKHLQYIGAEYEVLMKVKRNYLPKGTIGKMKEFLISSKKGWSEDNILMGWPSPEVANWCLSHPEHCPSPSEDMDYPGCELNRPIPLKSGKKLGTFSDVINHFKTQIECRNSSSLDRLLAYENSQRFSGININIEQVQGGIQFYTDVEKILQAYNHLIYLCIEMHKKKQNSVHEMRIEVALKRCNDGGKHLIILSILDKDAEFEKDIESLLSRYGNTFSGIIANQINGLCDLELVADFRSGISAKVSIWPRNEICQRLDSKVGGVQYNLIFYKG
ncbi:hypothetical protein MRBLMN1_005880 [Chitinophaga ginsengisegetis]|uniref:hypothetical protein n=1 Tax=Chitinophaga ginsengisegetis TaxID=393003 RepID=UPI00342D1ECF